MPSPVMPQASSVAAGAALAAMFCGMEKMPPATMEPTTSATSGASFNLIGSFMSAAACGKGAGL